MEDKLTQYLASARLLLGDELSPTCMESVENLIKLAYWAGEDAHKAEIKNKFEEEFSKF
jgi:hypothetical protein